jgi:hypothetical protein
MGEERRQVEEMALQHEAKARELEQQINALSKAGDEQANVQIKALQEQARWERQEAANLRRKAAQMLASGGETV